MIAGVALLAALTLSTPVFAPPTIALREPVPAAADEIAAGDFNGDGLVDAVVARLGPDPAASYPITVLLNKGKGRFVDATKSIFAGPVPLTQHPRQIVVADFNGDGRSDVFIADHGADVLPFPGYPNTLVLSQPGGKLIDASANVPRTPDFSHSAAAADVDGNGTIDLYVGNLSSGCDACAAVPPELLLNDGTGHFRVADAALPAEVAAPYSMHYGGSALVDVNGDRAPDLVLAAASNAFFPPVRSLVLLNDGHGRFSIASELPPKPFGPSANSLGMSFADLNGDGKPDLALASVPTDSSLTGAWLQILVNNGDGSFRDETDTRLPGQHDNSDHWIAFPQLVDVNGDGKPDLLTHLDGRPGAPTPAFVNDGTGHFRPLRTPALTGNGGLYVFVNSKPHTAARDVLSIIESFTGERYLFYRRKR